MPLVGISFKRLRDKTGIVEHLKGKNCKSAQTVLFGDGEQQKWTADSVRTLFNCSVGLQSCGALWLVCLLTVFWVISYCVFGHMRTHTMLFLCISCDFYQNSSRLIWFNLFFLSSPFEVTVGQEAGPQQIRAWGPGLEGGIVGKPATFVVESIGTDVGVLGESDPTWFRFTCIKLLLNQHKTSNLFINHNFFFFKFQILKWCKLS